MFKEIETELLSIMNEDPIEKIVHTPTVEIAKTMELIYNIKFEDIQRVYTENMDNIIRMVVVHKSDNNKIKEPSLCPINGKIYHITFFPSGILDKSENNAINLTKAVIKYVSLRIALLMDKYDYITNKIKDDKLSLVFYQSIPVITCAIIRKVYSGQNVPKIVYMSLCDLFTSYKESYSEEGINTIFNILDESLGVTELLDSGFICAIKNDDKNYPGIWKCLIKEEEKCNEE